MYPKYNKQNSRNIRIYICAQVIPVCICKIGNDLRRDPSWLLTNTARPHRS